MTDRFEDAVRDAARGLADAPTGDIPTYHGAWQRGRRRRMIKQAGVASAGVLALLLALTVNLGNVLNRSGEDTSEVATDAQIATVVPTTPPLDPAASTAPVFAPTPEPTVDDDAAASAAIPAPTTVAAEVPPPTSTPAAAAQAAAPTAAPTVVPPTAVPPTATPVPTAAPTPPPTATAEPSVAFTSPAPTPTIGVATDPSDTDPTDTSRLPEDGATAQTGPEIASSTGPAALPSITFIGPNQKADAIVLEASAGATESPCDLDRDGVADATCKLFQPYACTGDGDVRGGYLPVDLDEDGAFDTCVGQATTACDTSGDDLADTPCTIMLLPTPAEESAEDS